MQAQSSTRGQKSNLAVLDIIVALGIVLVIGTAPLHVPLSDPTSTLQVSTLMTNASVVFMLMVQGALSASRRSWGAVALLTMGWLVLLIRYPTLREQAA